MDETNSGRRIGRSVAALLAGFVVVLILSLGTDVVLHATGVFPKLGQALSNPLFFLATAYRTVYAIIGSYITARVAPCKQIGRAHV